MGRHAKGGEPSADVRENALEFIKARVTDHELASAARALTNGHRRADPLRKTPFESLRIRIADGRRSVHFRGLPGAAGRRSRKRLGLPDGQALRDNRPGYGHLICRSKRQ